MQDFVHQPYKPCITLTQRVQVLSIIYRTFGPFRVSRTINKDYLDP